jgi:hypothetical protein
LLNNVFAVSCSRLFCSGYETHVHKTCLAALELRQRDDGAGDCCPSDGCADGCVAERTLVLARGADSSLKVLEQSARPGARCDDLYTGARAIGSS